MSCDENEAMQKFLETPVFLEKLFPYLDLGSTLILAQSHQMTRNILQDSLAWNKLIRRNAPLDELEKAQKLGQILKLMKEPKSNMLDLLDVICAGLFFLRASASGSVLLGCPRHPNSSHWVTFEKLQLLEQVEAAFDRREQTIEEVNWNSWNNLDDPALSVLGDRLSSQQAKMRFVHAPMVFIRSKESAKAFGEIMEASQRVRPIHLFHVAGAIGCEGWSALAKGFKSHPGVVRSFTVSKEVLEEARRLDLRKVWDGLSQDGVWYVSSKGRPLDKLLKREAAEWFKMEKHLKQW